jgi:hypothetical protein
MVLNYFTNPPAPGSSFSNDGKRNERTKLQVEVRPNLLSLPNRVFFTFNEINRSRIFSVSLVRSPPPYGLHPPPRRGASGGSRRGRDSGRNELRGRWRRKYLLRERHRRGKRFAPECFMSWLPRLRSGRVQPRPTKIGDGRPGKAAATKAKADPSSPRTRAPSG